MFPRDCEEQRVSNVCSWIKWGMTVGESCMQCSYSRSFLLICWKDHVFVYPVILHGELPADFYSEICQRKNWGK